MFTYLPEWRRTRQIVGRVTATVMLLEVEIIDLQAWRGTTSHFNVAAPLDATLFGVMGLAIFLQTSAALPSPLACSDSPSRIAPWDGPCEWAWRSRSSARSPAD
jgi:hypothetical protein